MERYRDIIEKLISAIGNCRRDIEAKGQAKAKAIREYDMKFAIALATLNNSETYELSGKTYKKPPATITREIAKGIVSMEKEKLELAEVAYKATIENLEALKAQLNGYQSIFRHLE